MSNELCHFPAQDLLSLNEMREYVHTGKLPDGLNGRVAAALASRDLATSPAFSYRHGCRYALTDLLSWEEMSDYIGEGGKLPGVFFSRVVIAQEDTCVNCSGVKCVGCRVRDYGHVCVDDCPDCC